MNVLKNVMFREVLDEENVMKKKFDHLDHKVTFQTLLHPFSVLTSSSSLDTQ